MDFRDKLLSDLNKAGIDVSSHNVIDDIFIRKYLELNEPLYERIKEFPGKLSFKNFEKLDREDQEKFAGNFLVEVSRGEKAIGIVRLYFSDPTDIYVPEGTRFATESGLTYTATQNFEINSMEMENNIEGLYYYLEVEVEAEEAGQRYDVPPGSITICTNPIIMSRTHNISNPYLIEGGSNPETASELYNRVQDSISVRNLANDPSINSILRNNFPGSIINIYNVRAGSHLMFRDIVNIGNTRYRVGNKHDIWVETSNLYEYQVNMEKGVSNQMDFGFSIGDVGREIGEEGFEYICRDINGDPLDRVVVKITKVEALDLENEVVEEIEGVIFQQDKTHEGSVRQQSYLEFGGTDYNDSATNVRVSFLSSASLTEIQNFINDPANKMPLGDALAKHYQLIPLSGTIYYRGDVDELEMQEQLYDFFRFYHFNPERAQRETEEGHSRRRIIEISDIVSAMKEIGADKVQLPFELTAKFPYDEMDQIFLAKHGEETDLDHNLIKEGTVDVYNLAMNYIFMENEDYVIDYENGTITALASGEMNHLVNYHINYEFEQEQVVTDEIKILPYQMPLPKIITMKEG